MGAVRLPLRQRGQGHAHTLRGLHLRGLARHPLCLHRLQRVGPRPHPGLQTQCLPILLRLHHHPRIFHDQHLRRFCYRDLPV